MPAKVSDVFRLLVAWWKRAMQGRAMDKERYAAILALTTCTAYSLCSISMVIANKAILSTFHFSDHMFLLLFQTGWTFALVALSKKLGYITYEEFDINIAIKWLPLNLLFLTMLFTGYLSLKMLSVPLVTIFKNVTNVVTFVGEWWLFGQQVSPLTAGSLGLIILGALATGANDLTFSPSGYFWMFLNCMSTAAYVLYMRYTMDSTKLSTFGGAYYNSAIGLPLLVVLCVAMGELPGALYTEQMHDPWFLVAISFSGAIGFLLQLSSLWCMQTTSASTYSMVGALNKIPLSVLGVVLFKEVVTLKLAIFIAFGLAGGVLYTYAKQKEKEAAAAAAKAAAASGNAGGSRSA